jgi:hypothetical protein
VRLAAVEALTRVAWSENVQEERSGLRGLAAQHNEWRGQVVRTDTEMEYQSRFCAVTTEMLPA